MDVRRKPLDVGMDAAASKLVAALGRPGGHVVVTAARAGAAAELIARVDDALVPYRRLRLDGQNLDGAELAQAFAARDESPAALHAAVRARIAEARRDARPLLVIVGDADDTPTPALERLRLLLECTPDAPELVRLVLLGGPGLRKTLARVEARALASRVTTRVTMSSMAAASGDRQHAASGRPRRRVGRFAAAGLVGAVAAVVVVLTVAFPGARRSGPPPRFSAQHATVDAAPVRVPSPVRAPALVTARVALEERHAPPPPPPTPAPAETAPVPAAPAVPAPAMAAVRAAPPRPAARSPKPPHALALQVGAFRDPSNAAALRAALGRRFAHVTVTSVEHDGQTLHRVRIEGLATSDALQTALASLRQAGHRPFRVIE
jgi:cell division septation protein DedD